MRHTFGKGIFGAALTGLVLGAIAQPASAIEISKHAKDSAQVNAIELKGRIDEARYAEQAGGQQLVTYLGLGLLGLMLALQFIFLPILEKGARRAMDPQAATKDNWLQMFANRTILGSAFLAALIFGFLFADLLLALLQ